MGHMSEWCDARERETQRAHEERVAAAQQRTSHTGIGNELASTLRTIENWLRDEAEKLEAIAASMREVADAVALTSTVEEAVEDGKRAYRAAIQERAE